MKTRMFRIACVFFCIFFLTGCSESDSVLIGFSSTLSGNLAEDGIESRNAVLLAVDEMNRNGGILGKKIQLMIRDDQGDPDTARRIDEDLIDLNVMAIIGHSSSSMTQAVIPLMNQKKMLLLSPATVSDIFSGIDDFFIRFYPSTRNAVRKFAEMIFQKNMIGEVAFIYDMSNNEYTYNWFSYFKQKYEELNGKIIYHKAYEPSDKKSLKEAIDNVIHYKPKGLVILTSSMDAAYICREIRMKNADIQFFIGGWAMTENYLTAGGKYVEGATFSHNMVKNGMSEKYIAFQINYKERFGALPNFIARNSYETAMILFDTLKESKGKTPVDLKNAIIAKRVFNGLKDEIVIDRYGDREPVETFYQVKNGSFVRIQ